MKMRGTSPLRPRLPLDAVQVSRDSKVPINQQIYQQVRAMILDRTLLPNTRLPSSRSFAIDLGVSRNTIMAAYTQLETEGYVESRQGSSTYVVDLPLRPGREHPAGFPDVMEHLSQRGQLMMSRRTHNSSLPGHPSLIPGAPDIRLFPFAVWRRLLARRLQPGADDIFGYHHVTGYPPLKTVLARYLEVSRGVRCDDSQIVITCGAQAAFDLLSRILLDPGDGVWLEEPGYPGAQTAFQAAGAVLMPLYVDDDGWDLRRRNERPVRLIYVTPSCQSPLGMTMRMEQRLQLIDIAQQENAWILEDDFDGEYRFEGRPVPAMQGSDPTGRTIYVGTFSKTLFPALRIGFMVLPRELAEKAQMAMFLTGQSAPLLLQGALADFIAEGHFADHLGRMRRLYAKRREMFHELCNEQLGEWLQPVASDSGIQSLWYLADGFDDRDVERAARQRSVVMTPLSSHYRHSRPCNGLIFGYTALDEKAMRAELGKLRNTFLDMAPRTAVPVGRVPAPRLPVRQQ